MNPPNRSGMADLASMSKATNSGTRPNATAFPSSSWLRASNIPDLVSPSRNPNRSSISDTVSLGTGLMDIGSSARSDSRDQFSHWPRAPRAPDTVPQSRNLDLPCIFTASNRAFGSTSIDNNTRPSSTAVPFSHWLHATGTPDLVPQPQTLEPPVQSFFDTLPPRLRDRYAHRHAQDRTHVENGQPTVNSPNTPHPVSHSRNPDGRAQSFIENPPPRPRSRFPPFHVLDRSHIDNSQSTVSGPNSPDFIPQSQTLDQLNESLMDTLPPGLRDRYAELQARYRTNGGNRQTTVNTPNTSDLISQSRASDRQAPSPMDTMPPHLRDRYVQLQARDRTNAWNRQTTGDDLDNYQNPYAELADRSSARASIARHIKAETFLESLSVLSLADLAKDCRECVICLEPYQTSPHRENPTRLPCSHVMGRDCLLHWLKSSAENHNNNRCPVCRSILFDRYAGSVEDRRQSVHNFMGPLPGPSRPNTRVHMERIDLEQIERRYRAGRERLAALAREANEADDRLTEMLESRGDTARAQEVRARRAQREQTRGL